MEVEIREREKFMVCLHTFPAVYSWKSDSLPEWYSFVPATPLLHLNNENIPQRPAWIDDPKQYLNYVQLATKLHSLAPLIRILKLSGDVNYHPYEAPAWCCPQYIIPPAEGSLIYRPQEEQLALSWAPRRRGAQAGGGSAGGSGQQQPGSGSAGGDRQLPGCERPAGVGEGRPAAGGGAAGSGRRLQPANGAQRQEPRQDA